MAAPIDTGLLQALAAAPLDPLLGHLAAAALALVLLGAAASHARDLALFGHAIGGYELLPPWAERPAALGLTLLEAAAALALLPAPTRAAGAALAVLLLAIVTAAVVLALRRGHAGRDCGCGGGGEETPLSWALAARNAVLMALAGVAAWPSGARALVPLDAVALVGGTLALLGAYAAGNQLMANHPRLQRLRSQP